MAEVKKTVAAKPAAAKPAVVKTEPVVAKEAVKETVKPVETVKTVKEEVKPVEKKAEVKPVEKKAKEKPAVKKAAAKPVAKAASKVEMKAEVHFQFSGKSYTTEDMIKIAKDVWKYDLHKRVGDMKSLELYVKPEEELAYYVINGDVTGSFAI